MSDENSEVRLMATERWGPLGNISARPILKKSLKDKNDYVRIAAAESLFLLQGDDGIAVLTEIVREAPEVPGSETELGVLLQMRMIQRNKVRIAALNALTRMNNAASEALLRKTLEDGDGNVADAAAVALARQGDPAALKRFIAALGDNDHRIRERAARALGEAPDARTVDLLRPFAPDPHPGVRAAIMVALGRTRSMRAIPVLKQGLADKTPLVRAKAVEALGRIPSTAVIPMLKEALKSAENVVIELQAAAGLARLGEQVGLETASRALAQTKDQDARMLAIEVYEAQGDAYSIEQLRYVLAEKDVAVKVRAAAAIVKLLKKKDNP